MGIRCWLGYHGEYVDRHDYVHRKDPNHVEHEIEYFCKDCGKRFSSADPLWRRWDPYWYTALANGERREVTLEEIRCRHVVEPGCHSEKSNSGNGESPSKPLGLSGQYTSGAYRSYLP